MSILPDPQPDAQALAARLTAYQRMLLGKAGMPRWFDLAYPWEPAPGRQTHEAGILASPIFGLLRASSTHLGGYELPPWASGSPRSSCWGWGRTSNAPPPWRMPSPRCNAP